MATLLEKTQTLISANLHSMLDKALQANSLAVLDEYIRQAQDSLDDLEDAAATVGGQVKTLKRKTDEFEKKAQELDNQIDMLLQRGKDDLAVAAQRKMNNVRDMAQQYREQHERQQQEYKQLLDARLKLEAKLTEIRQERQQLQALLELAKAKEVTTKTLHSLDDLAGVGDADIARIADGIRARLDKASTQSEMRAARLDDQMDQLLETDEIQIQLEARKRRLGIGSTSDGPVQSEDEEHAGQQR
ncbi:MAG: PspA/IM30 family protein [Anaerolineae bacterium]|nr:PspA/IM30 family protein [Anaerolineae bacterium]